MSKVKAYNLEGLNLRVSPFISSLGVFPPNSHEFLRLVNMDADLIGAKKKRPGYGTLLTSLGGTIDSLFDWHQQDGTTFNLYAASGGTLYYSSQGTGAWANCGNGTFTTGVNLGHAVHDGTLLMVGDGIINTRHTTNGTSFTDTSGAPKAIDFQEYQGRMYALGTSNNLTYATTGTATDWTTDSASITIPGAGKNLSLMKVANRLVATKNSGEMYRWDGYNLYDMSTVLGPTSQASVDQVENYAFYLNRWGVYSFNGDSPEIVSNPIKKQIYNDAGSAIQPGTFSNAYSEVHYYNYLLSVGTVTDDLTKETINNCVLNYDFQLNQWSNYDMGTQITAMESFRDNSGSQTLILGDNSGQCYTYGGTYTNDNGLPIQATMEMVFHGQEPAQDKKFNQLWLLFNPGCQAHVQVAVANTFTKEKLNWIDIGDVSDGYKEFRFPSATQGRLLFLKITETSRNARFVFYGYEIDYDLVVRR